MCRWGCMSFEATFMCKFCGTRFCAECLRGDFNGTMKDPAHCRKCNQTNCQGKRVEIYEFPDGQEPKGAKGKGRDKSPKKTPAKKKKK
ncbi:unnamed protein product [Didymodactylos carnosus]|uniref:Uncharacterized protein n=1 Tax=Didymodactylos carnosus TaxID=1234261 RepID=A0A813ND22_9BILA|nr:unnamed protein product [Didymodactylos carnosus]CAF0832656.1 unnamed protein product [Didymodactylos carnosus]CAF3516187.1 unnamed protein product [Didymodactylos carnosus]CAF3617277.1 unnamed protein product [Didymodactylos carnosus]